MSELKIIMNKQLELQKDLGFDVEDMALLQKAKYIKENILWANNELNEMLHEIPFAKDWSKKYYSWDKEKVEEQLRLSKEEYIDAFHFFINIALALGISPKEILEMYLEKNEINIERQKNGY